MSSLVIICIWSGGWPPAWRAARKNGRSKIASIVLSALWPVDLGYGLATKFCDGEFK